jgi:hypothetical protein
VALQPADARLLQQEPSANPSAERLLVLLPHKETAGWGQRRESPIVSHEFVEFFKIDTYDEPRLRHRSSPAVLKFWSADYRQIFKIDAYDKPRLRHRSSPAVLINSPKDFVEFIKIEHKPGTRNAPCCRFMLYLFMLADAAAIFVNPVFSSSGRRGPS